MVFGFNNVAALLTTSGRLCDLKRKVFSKIGSVLEIVVIDKSG